MDITINPSSLNGSIRSIPSKSYVHRLLICAALSSQPSVLNLQGTSDDINTSINCLTALGASISRISDTEIQIIPIGNNLKENGVILNCGESGSTLRFMLPVCAALGINALFTGTGNLAERPIEPLLSVLREHGVNISDNHLPFNLLGKISGGHFSIPGNISSQYITGLMLALPLIGGGTIEITTELQSRGYVDMTMSVLKQFGIDIGQSDNIYIVPNRDFSARKTLTVQGDWSNAATWLCAGAISGKVQVTGLEKDNTQFDSRIVDILRLFGAEVTVNGSSVTVAHRTLRGITIDAGNIPDIIPAVAVVAAMAEGETHILNAGRLRFKESDRLSAICANLKILGADITEGDSSITIRGTKHLFGGHISGYNDHRMVMSAALSSLISNGPITVSDSEAVNKSYPKFFDDFRLLGGSLNG